MQQVGSLLKVLLLFSFSSLCSAGSHSLKYFHTAVTGIHFPEYTLVGVIDEELLAYYDSNTRTYIPKTEWIKKIETHVADYWMIRTRKAQVHQEEFKVNMAAVMKRFNHTKGVHTVQLMLACEHDEENITKGFMQFGYDGHDFISLDLKTETWTAANNKAFSTKIQWEATGFHAKYWRNYVENTCLEWLKKFLFYGRATLERKDPPEASVFQKLSSPPELVCHATGFFPKDITMFWQKNVEDVDEDVELLETLPNNDGSFQKRIILSVSPEELQKHDYTCVIQHSSMKEDLVLKAAVPDGGSVGVIVGAVVGLIALVTCAAAIFIWRKKKFGFSTVPPEPSTTSEEASSSSSSSS